MDGLNTPSYNALSSQEHRIRAIQELYDAVNKLQKAPAAKAFPSTWRSTSGVNSLCSDILNDSSVQVGDIYLGAVQGGQLPTGLINGELKIEVMGTSNVFKRLVLTLYSTNLAPYHWELVYAGSTISSSSWRSWVVNE